MATKFASCVYNINDLSDEVLSHIISFLPIKDAVRTSTLSRRWRYLCIWLSNLELKMDIDDEEEQKCFIKYVERLVFYRDIPSVLRLHLRCHQYTNPQQVSLWICALEWHDIQELDSWFDSKISDGLGLLHSLFSCKSLVVLKLNLSQESYELKIPPRICLLHVKVLHFHAIVFPSDGTEERLFSRCPVLEDLVLYGCVFSRGCVKFSVSNQNLKRLTLEYISSREERPVDILIYAPNLIFLSYSISSDYSLKLIDVKSLATVVIDSMSVSHGGYEHDTVILGALKQIRNIQTLKINYSVLRVFQRNKAPIPLFDKLACLKIWGWEIMLDPICLEYFFARCVVLETLVFEEPCLKSALQDTTQYSLHDSRLGPLLRHLKTFEIKLYDIAQAEAFMAVMGFFLENAEVLEEMKIYRKQGCIKIKWNIMIKLLKFRRASYRCRVLFPK